MISVDPYIIEFVSGNWIGLTIALAILKGTAKLTKGVTDDKVATLIGNILSSLNPAKLLKRQNTSK